MQSFINFVRDKVMVESKENSNIYKIALLVSISCVLQISESLIPHPIPGLRLGLANMLTLVALVTLGFRSALEIAIFRTVLSSFIMGTFMSPTFILSFSGAVISTVVMGFFYWFSSFHRRYRLSIIGISIIGALSHNIVQLYLAYLILVKHGGIFVFFPWLCIGAVVMGWITGIVAGSVCRRLKEIQGQKAIAEMIQKDFSVPVSNQYLHGSSFLHRLPAEIKIGSIFILSLAVLIFSNFWLYLGLFFFLYIIVLLSHTSFAFLFSKAKRYTLFMFVAFLLPVFFNSGTHVLSSVASFKITYEGLSTGALFAFRILFLILSSSLLVRTTSPEEITRGLARILSPLRNLGISEKRIATILSLSWIAIPFFWDMARRTIHSANLKRAKDLRSLIPLLSNLIATLYVETEPGSAFWRGAYPGQESHLVDQDTTERRRTDSALTLSKGGV
jgi:heptaprenyl diphosphate synthase